MDNEDQVKLDDRIAVRIDSKTKSLFMTKLSKEGANGSEKILQWIREYIAEEQKPPVDLNTIYAEVEALKSQMTTMQSEMVGKLAA